MKTCTKMSAALAALLAGTALAQCDSSLLLAPDRLSGDNLGFSVSAKNGWLAMGAHHDDNIRGQNAGSVYVWQKTPAGWQYYSRFQSASNSNYFFGHSVATDGTTMVIGAGATGSIDDVVYVMERHADGFWYPAGQLPYPPGYLGSGQFGYSVAVQGDRIAVGAPYYSPDANRHFMGGVFMYRRVNGAWQFHVSIVNPTAASSAGDNFGNDVALMNDGALVVGAPGYDWVNGPTTYTENGAVFLFTPSAGSYTLPVGGVISSGLGSNLNNGRSVATDGAWIAWGVPGSWSNGADRNGHVAVAKRNANNSLTYWASGTPSPAQQYFNCGSEVAMEGNRVVAAGSSGGRVIEWTIPVDEAEFVLNPSRIIDTAAFGGSQYAGWGLGLHAGNIIVGDMGHTDGTPTITGAGMVFASTAESGADDFENATFLALPATAHGCTSLATAESQNMGANICGTSRNSPDVWYAFTANRNGIVTALLDGQYDCVLSAHLQEPRNWDSFAFICNDDMAAGTRDSKIQFGATNGTTYYLRCSGYNGATGGFTLTVNYECVADVDDGSGTGTPDGGVTIDDLLYYLNIFEQGLIDADVDDGSATGTLDGGVTIDDLLYYLARFESGC